MAVIPKQNAVSGGGVVRLDRPRTEPVSPGPVVGGTGLGGASAVPVDGVLDAVKGPSWLEAALPLQSAGRSLVASAKALVPAPSAKDLDPYGALERAKDGTLWLTVPMRPGTFELGGMEVTARRPEGASTPPMLRLRVEVRDGKVVPSVEGSAGRAKGSWLAFDPPLEGAAWLSIEGAAVRQGDGASAELEAKLRGFVDLAVHEAPSLSVKDVAASLRTLKSSPKAQDWAFLATDQLSLDGDVTFQPGPMSLGAAHLDLAPGSKLHVHAQRGNLTLSGEVSAKNLALSQEGLALKGASVKVGVRAQLAPKPDGSVAVSGTFDLKDARLEGLVVGKAPVARPGAPALLSDAQHVALGSAQLSGQVGFESTLSFPKGAKLPTVRASQPTVDVTVSQASALSAGVRVDVPGTKAGFALSADAVRGRIAVNQRGVELTQLSVDGLAFDAKEVVTSTPKGRFELPLLSVKGNATLDVDSAKGTYALEVGKAKLEAELADFQAETPERKVDLGRSRVRGALDALALSSDGGLKMQGDIDVQAAVDSVQGNVAVKLPSESSKAVEVQQVEQASGTARLKLGSIAIDPSGHFALKDVESAVDLKLDKLQGAGAVVPPEAERVVTPSPAKPAVKPMAPVRVDATQAAPDGVVSEAVLASSSPAKLGGLRESVGAELDLMKVLPLAKDGLFRMVLPVEGTFGEGTGAVTFPKGTQLTLVANVQGGKLVPGRTTLIPSVPGEAAVPFVRVESVGLEKGGQLSARLSSSFSSGLQIPYGLFGDEALPLELGPFVERVQALTAGGSSSGKVDWSKAEYTLTEASFKAGKLALPGAELDLLEASDVALRSTAGSGTLSGRLKLAGVEVARPEVALSAGPSEALVSLEFQKVGDKTQLLQANLDELDCPALKAAVLKGGDGEYVHLGNTSVQGGHLGMSGLAEGMTPVMDVHLPKVSGAVRGARFKALPTRDGASSWGAALAQGKGRGILEATGQVQDANLRWSGGGVTLSAPQSELDAALRSAQVTGEESSGSASFTRLKTRGPLRLNGGVLHIDAQQLSAEVQGARLGGADLDVSKAALSGSGAVDVSAQGLDFRGKLGVDAQVDAASVERGKPGAQGKARLGENSRVKATLSELSVDGEGNVELVGKGNVDLNVENFTGKLGPVQLEGQARIAGPTDIKLSKKSGLSLSPNLRVDIQVDDASAKSQDGSLFLDLAKGSTAQVTLQQLAVDGAGEPSKLALSPGARLEGSLDGGQFTPEGAGSKPIRFQPGTRFRFEFRHAELLPGKRASLEGSLHIEGEAMGDAASLSGLEKLGLASVSVSKGRTAVALDIDSAKMLPDGSFEVAGVRFHLEGRIASLKGSVAGKR